jgi:transcriptional regulator with GAF, ATPase, and Fis domain
MEKPQLSVNVRVAPGAAPAAGYADAEGDPQQAAQAITARFVRDQGEEGVLQGTSMGDLFSSLAMRLRREIVFDAFAIFRVSGDAIQPRFAFGEDSGKLLELKTCSGQGLLGWVVLTVRAIRNANPAVDIGSSTRLRSALVAPICIGKEIAGLIALYSTRPDAFSDQDLRVLADFQQDLAANLRDAALLSSNQVDGFNPEPQKQAATLSSQIAFGHS